jgi:hypothetical protein
MIPGRLRHSWRAEQVGEAALARRHGGPLGTSQGSRRWLGCHHRHHHDAGLIAAAHQELHAPVILIWSSFNTHISAAMQKFVSSHPDWLTEVRLPAYYDSRTLLADQGVVPLQACALMEPACSGLVAPGPCVPVDDERFGQGPGGERGCDAPDLGDGERDQAGVCRVIPYNGSCPAVLTPSVNSSLILKVATTPSYLLVVPKSSGA